MKSFKKAAGLLLLSYLGSVSAHGATCEHEKFNQFNKPVPHYVRSTLEDLDLAAGHSPYTGRPHKSITITINPDGSRTIKGGSEEDFKRFFETDPSGGVHPRGSNFGKNDPFKGMFGGSSGRSDPFGSKSPFGGSSGKSDPFGGRSGRSDPFGGRSPFGGHDDDDFGSHSDPFSRPKGQKSPASGPSQKDIDELEDLLRKLRDLEDKRRQQTPPADDPVVVGPTTGDQDDQPLVDDPQPQEPQGGDDQGGDDQGGDDQGGDDEPPVTGPGSGSGWRDPLEDLFKKLGRSGAVGGGMGGRSYGKPAEPLKQDNPEGSPFRIFADYSTVKVNSQRHHDYITKALMPAVMDYFTATIKLKYPAKEKITSPDFGNLASACDGGIPRSYVTQGKDNTDLVILTRVSNAPYEGYVARACSCVFDSRSGRALISSINFNLAHIKIDEGNPLVHAKNIYTTLHELTHVLGFAPNLYENFLLPNGQPNKNVVINANGMQMINVEPLTSRLRKHYGCDKIQGAPLENQGGGGSLGAHFERRVFFNEFMTASEVFDGKISEFTLALLEGTGWYVINYANAEPFYVGKGQGCEYFYGKCVNNRGQPNFPEFCAGEGKRLCSNTNNGIAICSVDPFSDNCPMPHVEYEYDCRNPQAKRIAELLPELQVFGPDAGSKCFWGNLVKQGYSSSQSSTYCLNYKCNGTGAATTLDIIIGKSVAKCTKAGKVTVPGFSGAMDCPDPLAFCSVVDERVCPRGCTGRGKCVDGKCQCNAGFKGFDCAYTA